MEAEIATYNEEVGALLDASDLGNQKDKFKLMIPADLKSILETRSTAIMQEIEALKGGVVGKPDAVSLALVGTQLRQLNEKSLLTETKKKEHDKFQKDRRLLEEAISSLEREIKEINDVSIPKLSREQETRHNKYCEYLDLLREEKSQLDALYKPLQDALLKSDEMARRLTFFSKITFNILRHAASGYDLVDRRKVLREEDSLESALKTFFYTIEDADFSHDQIKQELKTLQSLVTSDGQSGSLSEILRTGKGPRDFANWFFGTDYFTVTYSIKYDGKDLQFLSPGEKGIVLLLLYLEAEQEDNRPLIIDQPDDNLDNLSIYPSLVEYFRNRKKTRSCCIT